MDVVVFKLPFLRNTGLTTPYNLSLTLDWRSLNTLVRYVGMVDRGFLYLMEM